MKKDKYEIIEKTILLLCALYFVLVVVCGCESTNVTIEKSTTTINGRQIQIYTIDSCEYVGTIFGSGSDVLSHKGNCKFCAERSKK